MNRKKILIIAGPNGAGKTTFAREFLPNEAECPICKRRSNCSRIITISARSCFIESWPTNVGRN